VKYGDKAFTFLVIDFFNRDEYNNQSIIFFSDASNLSTNSATNK